MGDSADTARWLKKEKEKPKGLAYFAANRANARPTRRRDKSIAAKIARSVGEAVDNAVHSRFVPLPGLPNTSGVRGRGQRPKKVTLAEIGKGIDLMSGAYDIRKFAKDPNWANAGWAAMAIPIPGKVIPLGGGRKLVRAFREDRPLFHGPFPEHEVRSVSFTGTVRRPERRLGTEFWENKGAFSPHERRRMIEHSAHTGMPGWYKRELQEQRRDWGIPVQYNLVDPKAPADPDWGKIVGSVHYHIADNRVYVDEAWVRPDMRNNARTFLEMVKKTVLPATEGGKRYITATPANPGIFLLLAKLAKKEDKMGIKVDSRFHNVSEDAIQAARENHKIYIDEQRANEAFRKANHMQGVETQRRLDGSIRMTPADIPNRAGAQPAVRDAGQLEDSWRTPDLPEGWPGTAPLAPPSAGRHRYRSGHPDSATDRQIMDQTADATQLRASRSPNVFQQTARNAREGLQQRDASWHTDMSELLGPRPRSSPNRARAEMVAEDILTEEMTAWRQRVPAIVNGSEFNQLVQELIQSDYTMSEALHIARSMVAEMTTYNQAVRNLADYLRDTTEQVLSGRRHGPLTTSLR